MTRQRKQQALEDLYSYSAGELNVATNEYINYLFYVEFQQEIYY